MKKFIFIFTIIALDLIIMNVSAQTFEIRLVSNDADYLEVQMKETSGTGTPNTSTLISTINFQIRWLSTLGTDIDLTCSNNDYNIADGWGSMQTQGSYNYRAYYATNTPFNCPTNWVTGQWETITTFKVTTGSGTGTFEVAPDNWVPERLNWAQGDPAVTYHPTANGQVDNYSYPTLIYNYVWQGGSGPASKRSRWENTGNWEGTCSGDAPPENYYPYDGQSNGYIYIPGGLTYYPETTGSDKDGWYCTKLLIGENAHVSVPDLNSNSPSHFTILNDLTVKGKLYLPALGYATVGGTTEIDNAEGIEVQADATGTGSFIDNGTITYGTSGSAKVQTFLHNGAASGSFYLHTVGPTVDVNGVGGALLGDFDLVNLGTYAYKWDETVSNANGWVNVYDPTYLVATGDGIALSTTDATDHTIELTGNLKTGSVNTPALTFSNNHLELISNPYPSAIDFQAFSLASGNASVINAKSWIWDPSSGNYKDRTYNGSSWTGSGSQYIQVGQAFFVQTISAGTVTFDNSYRSHSNVAFRDANANELKMKVTGGDHGFKDELNIMFVDNATYGYDDFDTYKWNSMFEDATMIRSIADDGSELSVNFLPLDGLQGDMVSVPVHFQCGYSAEYTFDFEGIDSFEAQNEVWLEDKQDNDQWIILNGNPHYTFSATPDDPHDRFILHFFGPTGINNKNEAAVGIYSWRQYAYIKNITNENIKKVSVYDISGHLVTEKEIPQGQKLSKIWVSDQMAYYVVQVITDDNVYTNKILITK